MLSPTILSRRRRHNSYRNPDRRDPMGIEFPSVEYAPASAYRTALLRRLLLGDYGSRNDAPDPGDESVVTRVFRNVLGAGRFRVRLPALCDPALPLAPHTEHEAALSRLGVDLHGHLLLRLFPRLALFAAGLAPGRNLHPRVF